MKALACAPIVAVLAFAACERAPNYNAGIPGGRSSPVDPDAGKPAVVPPQVSTGPSAGTAVPAGPASNGSGTPGASDPVRVGLAPPPKQFESSEGTASPAAPGSADGVVSPPSSPDAPSAPQIDLVRQHAASKRFDEIRGISKRFRETQREMHALSDRLSQGVTEADRKRYIALEKRAEEEWPRLRAYMWDDRWSEFDRAAMGLIIYGD